MKDTLHADQCTFLIISRPVLLRMRNVTDRICRENQNTFLSSTSPHPHPHPEKFNEVMWKNIGDRGRLQMTIRRMCIACWIPKATITHSEYVIYSLLFHSSSGLQERTSVILLHVHCLSRSICVHNQSGWV